MFSADDYQYMARALYLAEHGLYTATPNPRVGCVIVNHGKVVGEGAHLKAGEPHAEVFALREAGEQARGATAYVTLEPCSHTGRTPPCANALLDAGVKRVVAAMQDPNPLVAGAGLQKLREQGLQVEHGLLEVQARELNAGFILRMTEQRPFVRSKVAASLDGRTALANGQSQWITSEASRLDVQHWRARSCAILTGIGTVLADNPIMTVRTIAQARQPLRVIVDSQLQTPADAKILQGGLTLIAYVQDKQGRAATLQKTGVELLCLPETHGKVCLKSLLRALSARGVNELMCEAGSGLNGALLALGLVDELLLYYAPSILGADGQGMFGIPALTSMQQRINLQVSELRQVGSDIRIRAKPLI